MTTITDNTRRIRAIRECIKLAGIPLSGWTIARLSRAYQDGVTEPMSMLNQSVNENEREAIADL